MKLNIEERVPVRTVAVVTPTIGGRHLSQNVLSVQDAIRKYKEVSGLDAFHHIVVDGELHETKVRSILGAWEDKLSNIYFNSLQDNVGGGNWYGHRVYAAWGFLINADAICFLDEDNWIEPNHLIDLVSTINTHDLDWSFSFRKIYSKEGEYLCEDNCESLGIHPVYFNPEVFHVDTSSYCVRRDVAVRIAPAWYGQWGADRNYFGALRQFFPKFGPTGNHTLCYRLDGNDGSVTEEFFVKGNAEMTKRYNGVLLWKRNA